MPGKLQKYREQVAEIVPGRESLSRGRVYGAYLRQLDPRANEDVQLALAASPDPRFKEFLERVLMPKYRHVGLHTIAKACRIGVDEFANWWQREAVQRSIAKAQMASIRLTEEMIADARTKDAECPRCEGLGFIAAPPGLPKDVAGYRRIAKATEKEGERWIRDCPACLTQKTVKVSGDVHARDRLLEISGLVKKGGGSLQIVQHFGGASQASALADLEDVVTVDVDVP